MDKVGWRRRLTPVALVLGAVGALSGIVLVLTGLLFQEAPPRLVLLGIPILSVSVGLLVAAGLARWVTSMKDRGEPPASVARKGGIAGAVLLFVFGAVMTWQGLLLDRALATWLGGGAVSVGFVTLIDSLRPPGPRS